MEAEDIARKFGEVSSKGIGFLALFAISLLLFGLQVIEKLIKGSAFVSELILAGVALKDGKPVVATWLILLISLLFIIVIVAAVLLSHLLFTRKHEQDSRLKAHRSFADTMHAASVIRSRQTPAASHTVKTLEEITVVYRVAKDFTTTLTRQFKVKAAADALHFWETSIQPTSDAPPADYLSDIKFKATDITDPANRIPVTYLQTQNDVRHKCVCLYFLPRLLPSDPARTIEVNFTWPRYLAQLQRIGREDLFQNFNSAEQTRSVTIDLWFEEGSGGTFALDVVSTYPATTSPLRETGWSGFRYVALTLPPGRQEHKLSVTWTKS